MRLKKGAGHNPRCGWMVSYRKLQIAVLLQVTQLAINDNTFGLEVFSPEGHQTAVAGIDVRDRL